MQQNTNSKFNRIVFLKNRMFVFFI